MDLIPKLVLPKADITQFKTFYGLRHSSLSLAISEIAAEAHCPLLVITPHNLSAQQLELELQFFLHTSLPVRYFPDWETLPYDHFSPAETVISERISTLTQLPYLSAGIILCSASTLMHPVADKSFLQQRSFSFNVGDRIHIESFRHRLTECGYQHVNQVLEHGEFAIRGSIIDLFPMGSSVPFRIELFDDEIESIRSFDVDDQKSIEKVNTIQLLPAAEYPLDADAITRFRQNWRAHFAGNPSLSSIYSAISQGLSAAGIEYYLPLFFDTASYLLDFLPQNCLVVLCDAVDKSAEHFWVEVEQRYEHMRHDIMRPILEPSKLFLTPSLFKQRNKTLNTIELYSTSTLTDALSVNVETITASLSTINQAALKNTLEYFFTQYEQEKILICAETLGRREMIHEAIRAIGVSVTLVEQWPQFVNSAQRIHLTVASLQEGFHLPQMQQIILTETELFGTSIVKQHRRKSRAQETENIIRNLAEVTIGTPVVHIDYGVGRYQGLQTITIDNCPAEYLVISYANNDKIYVPVSSLHLISRYSGIDPDNAPLHRLGSNQWEKEKQKAKEKVRDVAAELLDLYAQRAAHPGFRFPFRETDYFQFASEFPFELTIDQEQAIEQVIADMCSEKTMDRLICGDVGFGKTEVAMRAAFIAMHGGKQVAILVPTTLLAEQHYQNFQDRFANWAVKIDSLSRFKSAKQTKAILEKLQQGQIDCVIGTHKLLQHDVTFKNLGLVIIDEEHRFGVNQKEKLKQLRAEVDILALTATPIPRTLNMALTGIRDISIIATPPAKRLAIKTFILERNKNMMREAILREIMRGGQVYFVHNDIKTIERVLQELQTLVPEAKVQIAHGQMRESELEKIMSDFYHHRFHVLLCTTIIETGIDIPSVNTIIIDRADCFGLAQLHQLRGRVGRSYHQAYAYLMTPPVNAMTEEAKKRLDAISKLGDLGAGFTLATYDLEIRGVGEILGQEQSGHIQSIGFSLYNELLERAMKSLQAGQAIDLDSSQQPVDINLNVPALIPDDYLPDVHIRLVLYKRLASCIDEEQLNELRVEMIDRFGLLPDSVKNLVAIQTMRLQAQTLGIQKIDANQAYARITFDAHPKVDPKKIIQLIQTQPQKYKLENANQLKFNLPLHQIQERMRLVESFLSLLTN